MLGRIPEAARLENLADDIPLMALDESNDAHGPAALGADQGVGFIDLLDQCCPALTALLAEVTVAIRRRDLHCGRTLHFGPHPPLLVRGGVWLNFFGLPVFNNSAMAALALRTGAAIVCSVGHPLPGGRARVVYSPKIEFSPTGNYEADLQTLSQKCLDFCEDLVRRNPEHWMWSYKRWKHCPTPDRSRFPFYATHGRR